MGRRELSLFKLLELLGKRDRFSREVRGGIEGGKEIKVERREIVKDRDKEIEGLGEVEGR